MKYRTWKCDCCGAKASVDGEYFPCGWGEIRIDITVRKIQTRSDSEDNFDKKQICPDCIASLVSGKNKD